MIRDLITIAVNLMGTALGVRGGIHKDTHIMKSTNNDWNNVRDMFCLVFFPISPVVAFLIGSFMLSPG